MIRWVARGESSNVITTDLEADHQLIQLISHFQGHLELHQSSDPRLDDAEDGGVGGGDDDGVPIALPPHPTCPLPLVIYSGTEEEGQEKPNIWLFPN